MTESAAASAAPGAAPSMIPGRVIVTEKALRRVLGAIAAAELGVAPRDVDARVRDASGSLAVDLNGPVAVGGSRTQTAIEIAQSTRARVRDHGFELSGARITDVRLRLTGAREAQRERVL